MEAPAELLFRDPGHPYTAKLMATLLRADHPIDFAEAVRDFDPAETLFIVSSKTFTTLETMTNARTARAWALAGLGNNEKSIAKHFGFSDWRDIYRSRANDALRALRPNPDQIRAGDRIFIPPAA